MATEKISTGKVDEAAPLAANEGSPFIADIDPSKIRVFTGTIAGTPEYLLGGFAGSSSGNPYSIGGEGTLDKEATDAARAAYVDPAQVRSLLTPQLGDISIKSQEVDWTTTPPTVKVVLRVKNSTGREVVGLKGLRST